MAQKFYAVRVTVTDVHGGITSERDYVRGNKRMSRDDFDSFAIGDMIRLVTSPGDQIVVTCEPIGLEAVSGQTRRS